HPEDPDALPGRAALFRRDLAQSTDADLRLDARRVHASTAASTTAQSRTETFPGRTEIRDARHRAAQGRPGPGLPRGRMRRGGAATRRPDALGTVRQPSRPHE